MNVAGDKKVKNFISMKFLYKLKNTSLKNKLIFYFILAIILPVFLLQTFFYYYVTKQVSKKINNLAQFNLSQTKRIVDATISSYNDLVYQIFTDDEIINLVKKIDYSTNSDEKSEALNELNGKLTILSYSKNDIRSVVIICSNGKIAGYDRTTGSSNITLWSDYNDPRSTTIYKDAMKYNRSIIMPSIQMRMNDKNIINIAKKMYDLNNINGDGIGVVIVSFNENSLLSDETSQYNINKDGDSKNEYNFIVDDKGNIISFPIGKYIGYDLFDLRNNDSKVNLEDLINRFVDISYILDGKPEIINKIYDDNTGWTIVNVIDRNYLFKDIYELHKIMILFGIIIMVFTILVIIYISGNLTKSIKDIVKAMKAVQNRELTVQLDTNVKDEVSIIAYTFNKMVTEINKLIDEVKYKTNKQKESEIAALEAQINPHFLYNTLDSINWIAIEHEEYEISRMLKSLAQILRYSIYRSNEIVSIREEIEWLRNYVYLQANRFTNCFDYIENIDECILDFKIHKLILQPFIENSIIHGFEGMHEGGVLKVRGSVFENGFIKIVIEDNGKGMSIDKLNIFQNIDVDDDIITTRSFGIKSTLVRLKMYYGDRFKFNIDSKVGCGTKITIIIPIISDEVMT